MIFVLFLEKWNQNWRKKRSKRVRMHEEGPRSSVVKPVLLRCSFMSLCRWRTCGSSYGQSCPPGRKCYPLGWIRTGNRRLPAAPGSSWSLEQMQGRTVCLICWLNGDTCSSACTQAKRTIILTRRAGVARRHVEAIGLMWSVGVRISRDVDATDCLLHPVGVSEMEAALEAALVF